MKFKRYIREHNIEEINELIPKVCKPYLNMLNGKTPFYRGMEGFNETGRKKVRTDRSPIGTPRRIFDNMNKWLKANGHVPRDNAMIATSNIKATYLFGEPCFVFPMGNFKYTWMRSGDMNVTDDQTGYHVVMQDTAFSPSMKYPTKILGPKKVVNSREEGQKMFGDYIISNMAWEVPHKKGYEIWFQCKDYYWIRADSEWGYKWR